MPTSIYPSILDTIGHTPLVELSRLFPFTTYHNSIFAKVESFNPSGAIKVRIARAMIERAENQGLIGPFTHIVEPTSGNTGIGLAMVAAVKGYSISLIMPENASIERQKILRAYGAKVILTPAAEGIPGAIAEAKRLAETDPSIYIPNQFENPANPLTHEQTTAEEIWDALDGNVDAIIIAVGTGGTLTGIARKLKQKISSLHVVAVEPEKSQVLSGHPAQIHKIQGMGAGFVPSIIDRSLIDEIIAVSEADAYAFTRRLANTEGIFAGISSGAALAAVHKFTVNHPKFGNIVTILPDTGERYLSTDLWE